METVGKLLTLLTISVIPLLLLIGFLTNDEYRNVPVFLLLLFTTYVGASVCKKLSKRKS